MKRPTCVMTILTLVLTASSLGADNSFYRVLASKPNATFEDAVRGFFELAVDVSGRKLTFAKQAQALVDMKIIRTKWMRSPRAMVTRGRIAYMICTTCGIKGGLTMSIFGPSERYAFRECVYLRVWEAGNQADYMTGGELMGLLKWAADYIEEHPKKRAPLRGSAKTIRSEVPAEAEEEAAPEKAATPPTEEDKSHAPLDTKKFVPPKPPAPKTTVKGKKYVVRKGDTFANISIRFYGTSLHGRAIMKANGIDDPWALRVGQTLIIPEKPEGTK